MQNDNGAKKSVILIFSVIFALLVALFAVILHFTILQPKQLDKSKYQIASPADFVYSCTISSNKNYYFFDGYAFLNESAIHALDNYVVLYHKATDTYLQLATQDILSEASQLASKSKNENYQLGGFSAKVAASNLEHPLGEYTLCFTLYNTYEPILVATAQNAEVNA